MSQQIGQVPNILPQTFFMPAATTLAQQPYQQTTLQAKHHKTNVPMDDYELSDDGSVNDDPGHTTNDWQCVQNNKKNSKSSTSKDHQLSYLATKQI